VVATEEDRERMQSQLVQAEKLASLGTLSAGIAHQLNNPLTAVLGFAELIERDSETPETIVARARKIRSAARRMQDIVDHICQANRLASHPERRSVDLAQLVQSSLTLMEPMLQQSRIAVSTTFHPTLPEIHGEPNQLEGVLQNLILNAREAFEDRQIPPERRLSIVAAPFQGGVSIEIEDNAGGMDAQVAARAFDPFFTTKDVGRGSGLGLYVAHGVVIAHHGAITLTSEPGQGTCFAIHLPAAP
jgi:signal transduction histidine kinase